MWADQDTDFDDHSTGPSGESTPLENVTFHLEVDGVDTRWGVRSVTLREAVGEHFRGIVEAMAEGTPPETRSLLGKGFVLRMERGDQQRTVRGLVRQVGAADLIEGVRCTLHVVPSAWQLSLGCDTRTHRETTIPDLVSAVVRARLGGTIAVDTELLTQTYEVHEFLVQYQESDWAFLSRWMEQEGIFWFFADGEEGEKLTLADGMDGLPFGRSSHDGRVPHRGPMAAGAAESVFDLGHAEELGPTRAMIREYDWTNPSLDITAQQSSDSPLDPAPEVYDHTDAVSFHSYSGRQYGHHTASRAARIRLEHLTLMRQRWSMHGNVLTAMPGHVLRVEGAPQGDLDGSYMIVRVESGGVATEGGTGTWVNSLVVVPTSVPYRPSPSTPRPVVPGPETAIVVGPDGQEIHTDEHGRVKVHFHWDRVRGRTDAESSCWIRVAQNWAGAGFGTFFLPRIGMEVVVSFLGGNPERPLVTGCVYNGANASPASPLPAKKTQSVIRTKSSLNSDGYNELRFEDEAGREFVSLHAQRNLLERVLRDHRTHVGHNQRNEVDNDQEITVHGSRTKTIDGDETIVVKGARDARIGEDGGDDKLWVINNQEVQIDGNRTLEVAFGDTIHVRGIRQDAVDGGITTTVQQGGVRQTIDSGGWTMTTTGNVSHTVTGGMVVDTSDGITMNAGANVSIDGATGVEVSGQSITLTTPTTASVNASGGVNVTSQGAIVLNSSTDIQMSSPQNLLESINAKIGAYSLALSVYEIKADVSGIKADEQAVVIKNGKFEAGTVGVHIRNMVANIRKGAAHIIG